MQNINKEYLNNFFVKVFNKILAWEEQTFKDMGLEDLTLRELHVIEAVYHLLETGDTKMSSVAKFLSITPGSLTTSVNTLVKKGYLSREASPNDRRIVALIPTKEAKTVNEMHAKFHMDLIDILVKDISSAQADALLSALKSLDGFFANIDDITK